MKLPRAMRIPWQLAPLNPLQSFVQSVMGQPVGIPLSYLADGDCDLRKSANAYVFGTESFSETLAKFRLQTHPIHMCTYNAGPPRQETQGLYLTDGESLSVNNFVLSPDGRQ